MERRVKDEKIKLYAEYGCYPTWGMEDPGDFPPDWLPLSQETIDRLNAWQKTYDTAYTSNYSDEWGGFPDQKARMVWEREGLSLWLQMQQELKAKHEVYYRAYFDKRPQLIYRLEELPDDLSKLLND
jgi:hypothetical protein